MFSKKIVIVTGGGSGIGKAISKEFSNKNAIVCILDKNIKNAEKTSNECTNKSYFFELDVTDKKQIINVFNEIVKKIGNYEILISNAGISSMNYIDDLTVEEWDMNMDVNSKVNTLNDKSLYTKLLLLIYIFIISFFL